MATSFEEFVRQKASVADWKERKIRRNEWLAALDRLYTQIRTFLNDADPDGVIEIVEYKVERVEQKLGVYDAPALKIRVGTASVNVVPMGLDAPKPYGLLNILQTHPGNASRFGNLAGGRVDVTDEDRRHFLIRSTDKDQWYVVQADRAPIPAALSRQSLEEILLDLMA